MNRTPNPLRTTITNKTKWSGHWRPSKVQRKKHPGRRRRLRRRDAACHQGSVFRGQAMFVVGHETEWVPWSCLKENEAKRDASWIWSGRWMSVDLTCPKVNSISLGPPLHPPRRVTVPERIFEWSLRHLCGLHKRLTGWTNKIVHLRWFKF